jgi:DsbC/DsbD-like thiol-disulfide interchange protein
MTKVKWILVPGAALFAMMAAWGQTPQVVKAHMVLATNAAHRGTQAKAAVVAEIASGYHINDHKPTLDYLIPTQVALDPSKQVSVEKVGYPKGQLVKFTFADESLSVYEGTLVVGVLLKVAPAAAPGNYTLKGKLRYQACNDHACLPPTSVPVELTLKVVDRGARLTPENADVFSKVEFE